MDKHIILILIFLLSFNIVYSTNGFSNSKYDYYYNKTYYLVDGINSTDQCLNGNIATNAATVGSCGYAGNSDYSSTYAYFGNVSLRQSATDGEEWIITSVADNTSFTGIISFSIFFNNADHGLAFYNYINGTAYRHGFDYGGSGFIRCKITDAGHDNEATVCGYVPINTWFNISIRYNNSGSVDWYVNNTLVHTVAGASHTLGDIKSLDGGNNIMYFDNIFVSNKGFPIPTITNYLQTDVYLANNSYDNHAINYTSEGGFSCGFNTTGNYTICLGMDSTPTFNAKPMTGTTASWKLVLYNGTYYNYTSIPEDGNRYVNCTGTSEIVCTWSNALSFGVSNLFYYTGRSDIYEGVSKSNNFTYTLTDLIKPNVTFYKQVPADINSTNVFGIFLNITYNITDNVQLNTSRVDLYFKVNDTTHEMGYFSITNGIGEVNNYNNNYDARSNLSNEWTFRLGDNHVYPAIYNINESFMEETTHLSYALNSPLEYLKVQLLNITNNITYNQLEIMINNSNINGNQPLEVYYCNSSYISGNPNTNSNCFEFYNIIAQTPYAHRHSSYSSHQLIPFAINPTTRMIGDVYVTSIGYFVFSGGAGDNSYNAYYISNISRIDAVQYSTNSGSTWSNLSGTIDLHLHQYNGNETLYYYACAFDIYGNQNCTDERYDRIKLAGIPPTSPNVYSPSEQSYGGYIWVNYTAAISPNGYKINYYNITLLNSSFDFVSVINSNNSDSLSYYWNAFSIEEGEYIVEVTACDVNGYCSSGFSDNFSIIGCDLTFYLDGETGIRNYELGTTAQITISSYCSGMITFNSDHPDFGNNYTSILGSELKINYSQEDIAISGFIGGESSYNFTNNEKADFLGYNFTVKQFEFQITGYNDSADLLYQEFADSYLITNSTEYNDGEYNITGFLFENYTKPSSAIGAVLNFAHYYNSSNLKLISGVYYYTNFTKEQNVSIPDSCFNAYSDVVVIRSQSRFINYPKRFMNISCFNGIVWINLYSTLDETTSLGASTNATSTYDMVDGFWNKNYVGTLNPTLTFNGYNGCYFDLSDGWVCSQQCDKYSCIYETAIYWNVTGPKDVKIDLFNDGTDDIIYPNYVFGRRTYAYTFTDNQREDNLSFEYGGSLTRYVNLSTNTINSSIINGTSKPYNMTITIMAIPEEALAKFDYVGRFGNLTNINTSSSYKVGFPTFYYYDDFSTSEISGKWDDSGNGHTVSSGYLYDTESPSGSVVIPDTPTQYLCCYHTGYNSNNKVYSSELKLQNHDQVVTRVVLDTHAQSTTGCYCTNFCLSTAETGIKDSTNNVYYAFGSASGVTDYSKTVLINKSKGYLEWYENGVYKSRMVYDQNNNYELYFSLIGDYSAAGEGYSVSCPATGYIYPVNISGVSGAYNGSMRWVNSTQLVTNSIHNTSINITRAKLTTYKSNPSGGYESLWLSANGGTNWESVTSGNYHIFSIPGNNMKAKLNVTITDTDTPFIIDYYDLSIGTGLVSDVKIDVGNDAIYEFNMSGYMNGSQTSYNISLDGSAFGNYIYTNCLSALTCKVPVVFISSTAGLLEYSKITAGQEINASKFNAEQVESWIESNGTTIPVKVVFYTEKANNTNERGFTFDEKDIIEISDVDIRYYGNKTTNLSASIDGVSSSQLMNWVYSPFELSYPQGVNYWEIFPTSRNQTSIQPYGQNSSRGIWQVTSDVRHSEGVDVYVKYNNSMNSCVYNNKFVGNNYSIIGSNNTYLNISLTTDAQKIIEFANSTALTNIWTYTSINCTSTTAAFYLPYYCFFSLCSDCVKTFDWNDTCERFE